MDTIFDPLRKMEVARTPEEEVRQSTIAWLNDEKGIPLVMMSSEYAFQYNSMTYRADIVVFGRDMRPLMIVECMAPSVRLDRKVIEQGVRYNRVLNARYMLFTNGVSMYFCERTGDGPEYRFLSEIPDIVI